MTSVHSQGALGLVLFSHFGSEFEVSFGDVATIKLPQSFFSSLKKDGASLLFSAKLDFKSIEGLATPLSALYKFPAITSITICLGETYQLERNLYARVLSSLAKLPYYDNIAYLSFEWKGDSISKEWSSFTDIDEVTEDPHELNSGIEVDKALMVEDRRAETIKTIHGSEWQSRCFSWKKVALKEETFLGKYVSALGLNQLALRGNINLPKGLQSFKLMVSEFEPSYCLPLLRCEAITTLFISIPFRDTYAGPVYPELNTPLELPLIKNLTVHFRSNNYFYYEEFLKELPTRFPNAISVTFRGVKYLGTFLVPLPDFPKIESLDIDLEEFYDISILEGALRDRLGVGGYPTLRTFKVSLITENIEAQMVCSISRFKSERSDKEAFGFKWEEFRYGDRSFRIIGPRNYTDGDGECNGDTGSAEFENTEDQNNSEGAISAAKTKVKKGKGKMVELAKKFRKVLRY
ncbi:hypothetical protein TWF481_009851 [Arthrobotrys musiformis]|uniref:Uncharacterized protein n=1 Tax=Arthrobotrys musiformis TaxID=47236 RepID=A0AAV9W7J7_9PEZI